MKIKTTLFLLFSFISITAFSQNSLRTFKGRILDSTTQSPLGDVSICIYRASDTSLLNFGFSTPIGNFSLSTKSDDSLLISISLLNYEEVSKFSPATQGWDFRDFGDIKLARQPFEFRKVSVKTAAISMRGDTIEINANRFKVLPGSDVAQLFKKIPGFEINVKGEIKVGGADVSKIMVDGSEFFGNNPGMVSKNLNADMIETVQVFDDRNEDGSPKENLNKVINLKLKKGKRNGMFGDAMGGYGTDDRYEGGLRLNSFKNDRKVSFVLNSNNINETGFDFGFNNWHNADNSSRNGSSYSRGGISLPNYFGESGGNINRSTNAGFTYFNEFTKRRKLSFNVMMNQNKFNSINSTNSIFGLNDSTQRTNLDSTNSDGLAQSAKIEINYTKIIDSTGYFDFGVEMNVGEKEFNSNSFNQLAVNNTVNNKGETKKLVESDNSTYSIKSNFRRNLRKNKLYYVAVFGSYDISDNKGQSFQYTENYFDTFNNRSTNKIGSKEGLVKLNARAPLYKKSWMLNLSVDYWHQNNQTIQISENAGLASKQFEQSYINKVDSLSLEFNSEQIQKSVKPFISFEKKGFYSSFGVTLLQMDINNKTIGTNASLSKQYPKFLPYFSLSYYPQNKAYVYFNVSKYSIFPQISELQPVYNIANTYERRTGNINLSPQDNIGINLYMNLYKLKGFRHFYNSFRSDFSNNAKVLESQQTASGIILKTPTNASGYVYINNWMGTSKKITKKFNINLNLSYNYVKNPNIVNKEKSFAIRNSMNVQPGFSFNYSDSLEFYFNVDWNNSNFKNTLNDNLNFKQNVFDYSASIRTVLKFGMEINSELRISDSRNVPGIGKIIPVWSAYLQQPLGKKGIYNIKLSAYDILKQNTNINRSVSDNFIYISQNNQLQRYFMLSLVYKIKKVGKDDDFQYAY